MGLSHEGREFRLISARLSNLASKDMLLNLCGEILIVRATSFIWLFWISSYEDPVPSGPLWISSYKFQFHFEFSIFLFESFGAVRAGTFYIFLIPVFRAEVSIHAFPGLYTPED